MEDIILMILTWMVEHDIHWYLFGIVFLLMPVWGYCWYKVGKDLREFKKMNYRNTKMFEIAPEYIDTIKKTNNDLQSEIKKLKSKIEELENPFNNPGKRFEAMQKKLDYYEKHFTYSLIWIKPGEKEPDTYNLCLCKCFDETTGDETNAELVYKLLLYKVFQARWCYINGVAYDGKVIEYAELPKL